MADYRITWQAAMDQAWETDSHTYSSWVEMTAVGNRGAPDVWARCEMRDGVPEVVDFRITAKSEGRAVRSADLNAWTGLEGMAINGFRQFAASRTSGSVGPEDERNYWRIAGDLHEARASSRGPSKAELDEVARVYRDAIDGRPTEAVQVRFGYSRRTAARRVEQARAAGLLPPTTPGKKRG